MQQGQDQNIGWLLLTTLVSLTSGFLASWLTYTYIKKREIIDTVKAEIEKQRGMSEIETEGERLERIRQEITRWANPILASVEGLEDHLDNILNHQGYLAMRKDYKSQVHPNWSISYEYFMNSSLFLFGQYFAWVQMLREELNFELFQSKADQDTFFNAIARVSNSLDAFPPQGSAFPSDYWCQGEDTQVFLLQQRAIGELFILRENGRRRCISYPDFLQKMAEVGKGGDSNFQSNLEPLKILLENISPKDPIPDNCKFKRLEATLNALKELGAVCKKILSSPENFPAALEHQPLIDQRWHNKSMKRTGGRSRQ